MQAADKGGGGADSPEEAVEGVLDALAREDVLGALDFLAPDEVRNLPSLYVRAEARARSMDLTGEEGTFSGFDVTVSGLSLDPAVEKDGAARVRIERGTLAVAVDPSQASRLLRPHLEEQTVRLPLAGRDVYTVEHDGGWYVSWVTTFKSGGEDPVADLIERASTFVEDFTVRDVVRLLERSGL